MYLVYIKKKKKKKLTFQSKLTDLGSVIIVNTTMDRVGL